MAALGGCAEPEVERPNVVFIVCDTLRADRTSTYGHFRTTTPNLDALGGRGTVFERAFAMSSWTLPSMSMLMTGEVKSLADPSILRDHIHVAESFLDAGYDTAAVVANPILNDRLGYDRGIESFVVDRAEQMSWRADEVFDKGLDWIDGRPEGERPFFLWLHPVDPHHPYEPLEPQSFAAGPGVDSDAGAEEETRDAARAALQAQREEHPESMLAEELLDADWDEVAAIRITGSESASAAACASATPSSRSSRLAVHVVGREAAGVSAAFRLEHLCLFCGRVAAVDSDAGFSPDDTVLLSEVSFSEASPASSLRLCSGAREAGPSSCTGALSIPSTS